MRARACVCAFIANEGGGIVILSEDWDMIVLAINMRWGYNSANNFLSRLYALSTLEFVCA